MIHYRTGRVIEIRVRDRVRDIVRENVCKKAEKAQRVMFWNFFFKTLKHNSNDL